ncbi:MAG: hypothetical protein PHT89_09710 [Lachnospiraceae bacterium]|nr:hypothetical protein [Lachnospiraceae bacterium]
MTNENQKIAKIVNALIEYFLSHQAKGINLSIQETKDGTTIRLSMDEVHLSEKALDELKHYLYMERQEEMEEYYWHLLGNDSETEEISLIGMMVDDAQVQVLSPSLSVELTRYYV